MWTTSRSMCRYTSPGTLRPESVTAASLTLLFGFFSESFPCFRKCSENIICSLFKLFIYLVQNLQTFFLTLLLSSFPVQLCKSKEAPGNPHYNTSKACTEIAVKFVCKIWFCDTTKEGVNWFIAVDSRACLLLAVVSCSIWQQTHQNHGAFTTQLCLTCPPISTSPLISYGIFALPTSKRGNVCRH